MSDKKYSSNINSKLDTIMADNNNARNEYYDNNHTQFDSINELMKDLNKKL
ncbi:hypothetical protein [Companilactobacillus mishanensis]|uniref:hypothetical protein n=1 Tax=Companilactobacillus mishanensis TaxID=2486008 RepID=UPI0012976325|nr:hypothetical protein [Companilactobacillus mishanensis]